MFSVTSFVMSCGVLSYALTSISRLLRFFRITYIQKMLLMSYYVIYKQASSESSYARSVLLLCLKSSRPYYQKVLYLLKLSDKLKVRVEIFLMYRMPRCPWCTVLTVCKCVFILKCVNMWFFCVQGRWPGRVCVCHGHSLVCSTDSEYFCVFLTHFQMKNSY